ncbi:hypothetical protein TIFTF001_014825 [Ficus carica]|uniref:NAP1-related protein 2 n=1 Tax=Ficus carica TaxID=3494 RepID=A0AA88A3F9_FICCA|nr:hypothetical protein TIFTF001_014825 [Ficus carica]
MVVEDKGKKPRLSEKSEDQNSDAIDEKLVLSIEKLQEIQDELEKINEEASDKVLEVEQKYNEIRKPVYDKRNDIIKAIPDFWLTAFLSHPALSELLSEEDQKLKTFARFFALKTEEIFKHLTSLEVEDFKDVKSGYSISFNFSPNAYFEDTKLTKTFTFHDEGTKITATSINWKEGMGIPNGVNHEKKGNKRPPTEESFFSWFTDTQQKDEMDEIHDEIADIIKEDLWPNPLTYFNNDPDEEDFEEEADEELHGKEDDDSEDDDDDQEDDEEEEGDEEDGKEKGGGEKKKFKINGHLTGVGNIACGIQMTQNGVSGFVRPISPPPPQPPGLTRYGSALSLLIATVTISPTNPLGEPPPRDPLAAIDQPNPPPTPRDRLRAQVEEGDDLRHRLRSWGHRCRQSQARRGRQSLRDFRASFVCGCCNLGEALWRVRESAVMGEEGGRSPAVDEHQMANRETKFRLLGFGAQ